MFIKYTGQVYHRASERFESFGLYLDLVAGGLVSLSAGPSLSSPVAPDHVLIQLLWDVQVGHSNQVTAMLTRKEKEGEV